MFFYLIFQHLQLLTVRHIFEISEEVDPIEIINNTREGIVMFIFRQKKGTRLMGQIQVPDAKLRRLTVFFIVYNIFVKMNISSADFLAQNTLCILYLWASTFYSFNDKMTAKINKDKRCPPFKNK